MKLPKLIKITENNYNNLKPIWNGKSNFEKWKENKAVATPKGRMTGKEHTIKKQLCRAVKQKINKCWMGHERAK